MDRGTEFSGKSDAHDYELFCAINDIDHSNQISGLFTLPHLR
jgi:hypothetical protein